MRTAFCLFPLEEGDQPQERLRYLEELNERLRRPRPARTGSDSKASNSTRRGPPRRATECVYQAAC